jgi:hypothetical protein
MNIITNEGDISYDDLSNFHLSDKAKTLIDNLKHGSDIFFSTEINLSNMTDFDDEIKEIEGIAIIENKYGEFSEPARAVALSVHLDDSSVTIDEISSNEFETDEGDYIVYLEDEADDKALDMAKDSFEENGVLHLTDWAKTHVLENFVNSDWFDDAMEEYHTSYAYDIKNDSGTTDEYINRLHEEMVDNDVLDYPEWPDEDDYESEEDFDKATASFKSKLETDVENDDNITEFVTTLNDGYDNGIEYWTSNLGSESFNETVTDNDLIDTEAAAKWMVDTDGRANYLSYYDGEEYEVSSKYKGKEEFYVIYRTN